MNEQPLKTGVSPPLPIVRPRVKGGNEDERKIRETRTRAVENQPFNAEQRKFVGQ